ncbi:MAG: hypothetical protein JWO77_2408 [Ilumatobacteraceae bacterium]|nr:hypothetical protein [Ilumatobacteraceae bacterium]
MATNRDSKQKRARQNRAQRDARQARAQAAAIPAEERKAKYASSTPNRAPSDKADGKAAERPRRERAPRLGDVPVDVETLEGNFYKKRVAVPGGRQVLTGMVLTIIITALTVFNKYPNPDATGDARKKLTHSFTEYYGSIAIPLVIVPLLAMAIATYFIVSPARRRIWTICAFVAALGAVVFGIPYAFPVGFLVYAIMRANKIEGPLPGSRAARVLEAREATARGEEPVDPDA